MVESGSSLSESLRSDQRQRWSRGERVLVESYVEKHPTLAGDKALLLDLIEEEFLLREQRGEAPTVSEYVDRFPTLREQVESRLQSLTSYHTSRPSTEPDDAARQPTRRLVCPYCEGNVALLPGDDSTEGQCPKCERTIHVLDETCSLRTKAGSMIGGLELVRRIGEGQYGDVWLARDAKLRRDVAVKMPRHWGTSKASGETFLREARSAAQLRHPNIVPVYDADYDGQQPYIVSAYIQGTNLKELLEAKRKAKQPYTPREAARLCQTIALAVQHAHDRGIVHRDLKPGNVLMGTDGVPYLADFGLAKHLSLNEATITEEGQAVGTPAYMSPEQARGQSNTAQPTSDVYSLGVLLYELTTGKLPFEGKLEFVFYQILTFEPEPPRKLNAKVPVDLETICLKAMAKAPQDRYASAQELADDLGRFLKGDLIQARPLSIGKRFVRFVCNRALVLVATLVFCVLGGAYLAAMLGEGSGHPGEIIEPEANEWDSSRPPTDYVQLPDANFKHLVRVVTDPPDAEVVCYPLDFYSGRPRFELAKRGETRTPTELELTNDMYLVVVHSSAGFHEVYRYVPRLAPNKIGVYPHEEWTWDEPGRCIVWPKIKLFPLELPAEQLANCEGAISLVLENPSLEPARGDYSVPPFQIEVSETSVAAFRRTLPSRFKNRAPELAANGLSWSQALASAESRGLRLPDLLEWQLLATASGTHKYPWGDGVPPSDNWLFDRPITDPRHDRLKGNPQITRLYSGCLEWTSTRTRLGYGTDGPGLRFLAVGGPTSLLENPHLVDQAGSWSSVNHYLKHPALGLRCARSPQPRLARDQFISVKPLPIRDAE